MIIGNKEYKEIVGYDEKTGEVVFYMTDEQIVENENVKVMCNPITSPNYLFETYPDSKLVLVHH